MLHQGWQEEFLRPAAPSISSIPPASRNIQELMRQQARAAVAVPTAAPPAVVRVPVLSPPPASPARNRGQPAVAAPAAVSKAEPQKQWPQHLQQQQQQRPQHLQ